MDKSAEDYNETELELAKRFYNAGENEDFFKDFFDPQNVFPGIWVKKFIAEDDNIAEPVPLKDVEVNSFKAADLNENVLNASIQYGKSSSVHLLSKADPSAVETFQVVSDWLSVNMRLGYKTERSLNVNLYRSESGTENSFDVVFDSLLGVLGPRSTVRIALKYDEQAQRRYSADGKVLENLPNSASLFFNGKKLVDYSILGYVIEDTLEANSHLPVNSKLDGVMKKFMCGLKVNGTFFGVGAKTRFEKFTSEQQIRAAVVLHATRLFCYASIWRVYFAFLNSQGTAYANQLNGVNGEYNNKLRETADTIEYHLGFDFFYVIVNETRVNPPSEEYTDLIGMKNKDIDDHLYQQFQGWRSDPARVANCVVQAKRIQANAFVPTESYQDYQKDKTDEYLVDKAAMKTEVEYYRSLVERTIAVTPSVVDILDIQVDEEDYPLTLFKEDFLEFVNWQKLNNDVRPVDEVRQRIFAAVEKVRARTLGAMDRLLRFLVVANSPPLYQLLQKLLVGQQLLKAIAYCTQMLELYAGSRDLQAVRAPLRAAERSFALFAARTLLDSLPIEKRTSGGKTELFASELQKIIDTSGGAGQVPVPDSYILDQMLDISDTMLVDNRPVLTPEMLLVGFSEFYRLERFYFADIVKIPWTSTALDEALFRFAILSNDDRAFASFTLKTDYTALRNQLLKPLDETRAVDRVAFQEITENFLKLPANIERLLRDADTKLNRPINVNNPNQSVEVVVALQSAVTNISHYFDAVETLETRGKIFENVQRYNLMIEVEKGVARVLELYKVKTEVPSRVPKLDSNVDGILDEILGGPSPMQENSQIFPPQDAFLIGAFSKEDANSGRRMLNDFVRQLRDKKSIVSAKTLWDVTYSAFENAEANSIVLQRYGIVKAQIDWLFTRFSGEVAPTRSPIERINNDNDDADNDDAEVAREFADVLDQIAKLVELVYLVENINLTLTPETVAEKGVASTDKFILESGSLLSETSRNYLEYVKELFMLAQTIAKEVRKFNEIYKGAQSVTEKAISLSREYADIDRQYRRLEAINQERFASNGLVFVIVARLRAAITFVETALKSVNGALKPEDAKRVDTAAKQLELERLEKITKQLMITKGALKDSLEELQLNVRQAEKLDADSSKYSEKLDRFTSQASGLSKRIDDFKRKVDTANNILENLPDVNDLQTQIDELIETVPALDETRDRLISTMPSITKDVMKVKNDVDRAFDEIVKTEKVLTPLEPRIQTLQADITRLGDLYNAVAIQYSASNDAVTELVSRVQSTKQQIEGRLEVVKTTEKTIDTTLATAKQTSDRISRKEIESNQQLANARSVQARVTSNSANITAVEVELAKVVVAARRNENDYDDLLKKLSVVADKSNRLYNGEFSSAFYDALKVEIDNRLEFQSKKIAVDVYKSIQSQILGSITVGVANELNRRGFVDKSQQQQQQRQQQQNNDDDNDRPRPKPKSRKADELQTVIKQEPQEEPDEEIEASGVPTDMKISDPFAKCLSLLLA